MKPFSDRLQMFVGGVIHNLALPRITRRDGTELAGSPTFWPRIMPAAGSPVVEPNMATRFLSPDPDSFVFAKFRGLSTIMLDAWSDWYEAPVVLDFTEPGMLEAAVPLAKGIAVYPDHSHGVADWIGVVTNSWWGANDPGLPVPGIDLELRIDSFVSDVARRVAMGLLSDLPTVRSGSFGMRNYLEMSHPKMLIEEFVLRQGEIVGGQIVRFIVREIIELGEYSLVYKGADPLAVKLARSRERVAVPNINPQQPGEAAAPLAGDSLTGKEEEGMKIFGDAQLARVGTILGAAPPVEDDQIGEALLARAEKLAADTVELMRKIADLTPKAAAGDVLLAAERAEVVRLAKIVQGDSAPVALKALEDSINAAGAGRLVEMHAEFAKLADAKLPLRCAACGSTTVERRSSVEQTPETGLHKTPASADPAAARLSRRYGDGSKE